MQPHDSTKVSEAFPDRRRHPRYRYSIPITIHPPSDVVIAGICIEISESGMSAITAASLKVNDSVEVEPIAGGKVLAMVRRNVGRVSGFEFRNLTPEQTERIRKSCKLLPVYRGESLGI